MSTKISALTAAVSVDATADYLPIVQSGVTKKINQKTLLNISGSPVGTTDSQALTNKTIGNTNTITVKDGSLTLQNTSDTTKQAVFSLASITTGNTRTYTMPNASVTLASLSGTETLTNKTLTAPTINSGTIDNATITVDSIAGHSVSNTGTIYGITVTSGQIGSAALASNSVGDTQLNVASVSPNKLNIGLTQAATNGSSTTTSTSYTTTLGDATTTQATITIGLNGLALILWSSTIANSVAAAFSYLSFSASGANTVAAGVDASHEVIWDAPNNGSGQVTGQILLTGLTVGSTTFTLNYKVSANTGTYSGRHITAIPL